MNKDQMNNDVMNGMMDGGITARFMP